MITIYDPSETDFSRNGICVLRPSECAVTEQLNGMYELELMQSASIIQSQYLREPYIIKAPTPKGYQLFRIYNVDGKTIKNTITVNARHIFYDLHFNFIGYCLISDKNGQQALDLMLASTVGGHNFTAYSDIETIGSTELKNIKPVSALLSDDESSFLSIWGGEIYRSNFDIHMLKSIGQDNGVMIAYRKNLLGLDIQTNIDETTTRAIPVGQAESGDPLYLNEMLVDSDKINLYPFPLINRFEFNDLRVGTEGVTAYNVFDKMKERIKEMYANGLDVPKVNAKVDFILLSKTLEYADYKVLEDVQLGDIVTVRHDSYGINMKAKCISYIYNCLTYKLDSIELGDFRGDLSLDFQKLNRNLSSSVNSLKTDISALNGVVASGFVSESDYIRAPAFANTTGTAAFYMVNIVPSPKELTEGFCIRIKTHIDSDAEASLKVNSFSAFPITEADGNTADLKAAGIYTVVFNGSAFILQ